MQNGIGYQIHMACRKGLPLERNAWERQKMVEDADINIKTEVDGETGNLEVFLKGKMDGKYFLWAQLLDEEGKEADRILPVEMGEAVSFCMQVKQVKLWNGERPCLYELVLELRDEKNRLLGCTIKKAGFYSWKVENGIYYLNEKAVRLKTDEKIQNQIKARMNDRPSEWEKETGNYLTQLKRRGKNALCLNASCLRRDGRGRRLSELCLEYGIYLLEADGGLEQGDTDWDAGSGQPGTEQVQDFELQVVEQGVLIENHCIFTDAREYELRYKIIRQDTEEVIQRGCANAQVPAGSSRFLELPFETPQTPGIYVYRVSLCLKENRPWAREGEEIASGEAVISNLWRKTEGM